MACEIDTHKIPSSANIVEYALDNIPAPGTGAEGRMEQLSVEEFQEIFDERTDDIYIVA